MGFWHKFRRLKSSSRSIANDPALVLSSTYNLPKAPVAIFQTLYASATLYRVKGDQIQRYGYAAFGLTTSPYLVMSIVNLISIMLTLDYPSIYLVGSEVLTEASKREGAIFDGIIGNIQKTAPLIQSKTIIEFEINEDERMFFRPCEVSGRSGSQIESTEVFLDDWRPGHPSSTERPSLIIPPCSEFDLRSHQIHEMKKRGLTYVVAIIISLIPIAINGALSDFTRGQSTYHQRVWTMTWLAFGTSLGISFDSDIFRAPNRTRTLNLRRLKFVKHKILFKRTVMLLGVFIYGIPAIGGLIVVAQMVQEYGHCVQLHE